jgi:hypothetical protein
VQGAARADQPQNPRKPPPNPGRCRETPANRASRRKARRTAANFGNETSPKLLSTAANRRQLPKTQPQTTLTAATPSTHTNNKQHNTTAQLSNTQQRTTLHNNTNARAQVSKTRLMLGTLLGRTWSEGEVLAPREEIGPEKEAR